MCGIAGTAGLSSPDAVVAMSSAMAHRGPDDSGVFFDAGSRIALAHRRLSIIDTSACGHNPMSYASGRYQIIFNGEIYNYRELRSELQALGHVFASHSDTEIVVAAFAEWKEASVSRLRGMFAFAIYDRDAHGQKDTILFLARDRLGIKPLYFSQQPGKFIFGSEVTAFLAAEQCDRRFDVEALWDYIALGSIPQPRTALRGVMALPPASIMHVRRDLTVESGRYWDLAEASEQWRRGLRGIGRHEAARQLRVMLAEATRLHMIADVPVGAFLSGGIDSTAVVGLMTRESGSRIRTFSVGFADDDSVADERPWARLSAAKFNTDHHEVVISGQEIAGLFDELVTATDQPSLDGTNTFVVSKAAGATLKVALSGLGGDELFAGYPHFRRFRRASRWDERLGPAHSLRRKFVRRVPGRFLDDRDFLVAGRATRYAELRSLADEVTRSSIANSDLAERTSRRPLSSLYEPLLRPGLDPVAQTSYVEVNRYLVDTLLRDADAMAMHSSLEVRPVLLDHVLAEFAFALPAELKLNAAGNKPVLVDAVRDLLPPEVLARRKTGFELPLQSWLIGPIRDRARHAFSSAQAQSVFAPPFLRSVLSDLEDRRRPGLRVWAYLMLIEWMSKYGVTP